MASRAGGATGELRVAPGNAHREPPDRTWRRRHRAADGNLRVEGRLPEAARAPLRVDRVAHVLFRLMNPLPAGRTDQRVVVQRGDDGSALRARHRRQVEREVQQIVHVHDVGLDGAQHVIERLANLRRPVGLDERLAHPVVDDLDDRQPVVDAPGDLPVPSRRVVVRAQHMHVMPR